MPADIKAGDLFGEAIDIDDHVAVVGHRHNDNEAGVNAGAVYIYRPQAQDWIQETKLVAPDGGHYSEFGHSAAVDGNVVVVGAPSRGGQWCIDAGAYVFRYDAPSAQWEFEALLQPTDPSVDGGCGFGSAVDVRGDRIAVFATRLGGEQEDQPSAVAVMYDFDHATGTWEKSATLPISRPDLGIGFVWNPANWFELRDDQFIGGAIGQASDGAGFLPGIAYIYHHDGNEWVEQAALESNEADTTNIYAISTAIEGDVAIVGEYAADEFGPDAGAAYIYRFNGADWSLEQKVHAPDGVRAEGFGVSAAVRGDTALIGARLVDDSGASEHLIYRFAYDALDAQWSLQDAIRPFDGNNGNEFGYSIEWSGDHAIARATFDDEAGENAGAAYIISGLSGVDCNGNGQSDACDIAFGGSGDENDNGIPDECETMGDASGDGIVDVTDLLMLLGRWGACPRLCTSDFDGNGAVDVADLLILLVNWG